MRTPGLGFYQVIRSVVLVSYMLSLEFLISKMGRVLLSVSPTCHAVWVEQGDNIGQRIFALKCQYEELFGVFFKLKF